MAGERIEAFRKKYGRLPTEFDRDYLRELEMEKVASRYKVLQKPPMHPGKCLGCGSIKFVDRKYVDLGYSLEEYGALYLCSICVIEMYKQVEPPKTPVAKESTVEAAHRIESDLIALAQEIREYLDGINVSSDNLSQLRSGLADLEEASRRRDEQRAAKSEQGTSEQTSSAGRANVSSLTEFINSGGDSAK